MLESLTHEVDRSGCVVRKETGATTSSLEIGTDINEKEKTKNHSDNYKNYFRTEQSATACR